LVDLFLDSVGREESETTDNPNREENHIVHAAPPQVKEPNCKNNAKIILGFLLFPFVTPEGFFRGGFLIAKAAFKIRKMRSSSLIFSDLR
jgi:hypothetical protein